MNNICLKEEVLQAYFDGELSFEKSAEIKTHTAACSKCAGALGEIEQQSALLASALTAELDVIIPTSRLQQRLTAAIAQSEAPRPLRTSGGRVREWFASVPSLFSFAPQYAVGFASVLVALILGGLFWSLYLRPGTSDIPAQIANLPTVEMPPVNLESTTGQVYSIESQGGLSAPVRNASISNRASSSPNLPEERPDETRLKLLPGEREYLQRIAELKMQIEGNDDVALSPKLRAEYERNLAVVDQAIANTRVATHRDPDNSENKDFLFTAYQNKVDLLDAVVGQAQLASR